MTRARDSSLAVSIITPVFDPEPDHLAACLESVRRQTIGRFEHILIDDGSTRPDVLQLLATAARRPNTRLITRSAQGGIVAATNDGLAAATGEFVAFVDHDDLLRHDALETMLGAVDRPSRSQRPGTAVGPADVVYSDHDFIDADGEHLGPCLKPEWSPERLRNQNYITHFVMAKRSLVEALGGLRAGFDGAQDHDLMLRMGEQARRIAHVPQILYHWRQAPSSVAAGVEAKPWAFDAGRRAVAEHCARIGLDATVEQTEHEGIYRIVRALPDPPPLISVLIPTRGSSGKVWGVTRNFVVEAVRSIIERSTYTNLEFVVIVDEDTPAPVLAALHDLAGDRLVIVEHHGVFNFSAKMNSGAAAANGEYLLLLNDDTELIEPDSIETLVGIVHGPIEGLDGCAGEVGMAGAKLLFDDGTIQHGGHVYFWGPHHASTGWSGTSPGPLPMKPLAVERECSGVTAAVAVVKKSVYDEVGGFPEELPLNYNDVDFSLKIRASGRRIVWSPYARWYHFESQTRVGKVLPEETAFVEDRWAHELDNDPYYNPQLSPLWFDWLEWPIDEPMHVGVVREPARPGLVQRLRSSIGNRRPQ